MNSSVKLKKNRFGGVKKRAIAQKFNILVNTNTFLLFFHYAGSKECNWEKIKKRIWEGEKRQNSQSPTGCKGFFIPSNLHSLVEQDEKLCSLLTKGPTLLIACSSLEQVVSVVGVCLPPIFLPVGGLYNERGVQSKGNSTSLPPQVITHLDIKEWISLSFGNSLTHQTAFASFLHRQLHTLHPVISQSLLTLLRVFYLFANNCRKMGKNK